MKQAKRSLKLRSEINVVEDLVLKRKSMLMKLSEKHEKMTQLTSLFELENELFMITENDYQLICDFKNTFDEIMTDVLKIESSFAVEYPEAKNVGFHMKDYTQSLESKHLKLKQQLFKGKNDDFLNNKSKKQDWKNFVVKDNLCSFTKWTEYLKSFEANLFLSRNEVLSYKNKLKTIKKEQFKKDIKNKQVLNNYIL